MRNEDRYKDEAVYLLRYDKALDRLKELIEGRDEDYAAIIRAIVENKRVSGKLRKTYPVVFGDEGLGRRVERAVLGAFELLPPGDDEDEEVAPRLDVVPKGDGGK